MATCDVNAPSAGSLLILASGWVGVTTAVDSEAYFETALDGTRDNRSTRWVNFKFGAAALTDRSVAMQSAHHVGAGQHQVALWGARWAGAGAPTIRRPAVHALFMPDGSVDAVACGAPPRAHQDRRRRQGVHIRPERRPPHRRRERFLDRASWNVSAKADLLEVADEHPIYATRQAQLTVVVDNETNNLSSIDAGIPQLPEVVSLLGRITPTRQHDGHDCIPVFDHLCVACHGRSVLLTGVVGDALHAVLFDVGPSGDVWVDNAERGHELFPERTRTNRLNAPSHEPRRVMTSQAAGRTDRHECAGWCDCVAMSRQSSATTIDALFGMPTRMPETASATASSEPATATSSSTLSSSRMDGGSDEIRSTPSASASTVATLSANVAGPTNLIR